jgi:hypothetical protein
MNLKELNSFGQKINKITKTISDINSINEARKGNTKSIERKVNNKIRNKIFNIGRKIL